MAVWGCVLRDLGRKACFILALTHLLLLNGCGTSEDFPSRKVEEACKHNEVQVHQRAVTSSIYIERPYLRVLVEPHNGSGMYYLSDVLKFMLANSFDAIETPNSDSNGNTLVWDSEDIARQAVVRVAVKRLGDPACAQYRYTREYPAQAWPWLRDLGIKAGECIGVEGVAAGDISPIRIRAELEELARQYNGMQWQSRLRVRLVDETRLPGTTLAVMSDMFGGSGGAKGGYHHRFLCSSRDAQSNVFRAAFSSPEHRRPPERIQAMDVMPTIRERLEDSELQKIEWIHRPQETWSTNLVNAEGTAWIAYRPGPTDYRYTFEALVKDTIVSTKITLPELGLQDVTGLAKSRHGFLLVAGVHIRSVGAQRYLIEVASSGGLLQLTRLSEEQYQAISYKK